VVDVEAVWREIRAVTAPGPDPQLPHEQPWKPPHGMWLRTQRAIRLRMALGCVLLVAAVTVLGVNRELPAVITAAAMLLAGPALWPWKLPRAPLQARTQAASAAGSWEQALKRWQQEGALSVFQRRLNRLKKLRSQLRNPQKEHERLRAELPSRGVARQLQRFLAGFRIEEAEIPGIGAGRKAALASQGILTAAGVERDAVRNVLGFGPQVAARMLLWRQALELEFRPDPEQPADPQDVQDIEDAFWAWLRAATEEFAGGPETLRATAGEIARLRPWLLANLERKWNAYQIALLARGAG